jgi:hypothetical protein
VVFITKNLKSVLEGFVEVLDSVGIKVSEVKLGCVPHLFARGTIYLPQHLTGNAVDLVLSEMPSESELLSLSRKVVGDRKPSIIIADKYIHVATRIKGSVWNMSNARDCCIFSHTPQATIDSPY